MLCIDNGKSHPGSKENIIGLTDPHSKAI